MKKLKNIVVIFAFALCTIGTPTRGMNSNTLWDDYNKRHYLNKTTDYFNGDPCSDVCDFCRKRLEEKLVDQIISKHNRGGCIYSVCNVCCEHIIKNVQRSKTHGFCKFCTHYSSLNNRSTKYDQLSLRNCPDAHNVMVEKNQNNDTICNNCYICNEKIEEKSGGTFFENGFINFTAPNGETQPCSHSNVALCYDCNRKITYVPINNQCLLCYYKSNPEKLPSLFYKDHKNKIMIIAATCVLACCYGVYTWMTKDKQEADEEKKEKNEKLISVESEQR